MKRWCVLAFALTACATTGGTLKAPLDAGVSRNYVGHSYPVVVDAARTSITEAGLAIDAVQQPDSNTMVYVGKMGAHSLSWGASTAGELARVVVLREAGDTVRVYVWSRRRVSFNLVARGDYSQTLFSLIDSRLQMPAGAK